MKPTSKHIIATLWRLHFPTLRVYKSWQTPTQQIWGLFKNKAERAYANSPSCQKDATEAVDVSPQRPARWMSGANHSTVEACCFHFIPPSFLRKKEVMIYQPALDDQNREIMIYIGYVFHGLVWWMLVGFSTTCHCYQLSNLMITTVYLAVDPRKQNHWKHMQRLTPLSHSMHWVSMT